MRLLALVPPGTNARSQMTDLVRGARLAGHEVIDEDLSLFLAMHQQRIAATGNAGDRSVLSLRASYASHLAHVFKARGCDMALTLWLEPVTSLPLVSGPGPDGGTTGRLSFLAAAGVTMLHWWLDAPFWAYEGRATGLLDRRLFTDAREPGGALGPARHIHAVNNAGTADEMRRVCNLGRVIAAGYGVDEVTFRPWEGVNVEFDLAINCGPGDPPPSKLMLAELANDEPDVRAIRQEQAWSASASAVSLLREAGAGDGADRLVDAWVQQQLNDPDRPMLAKFDAACAASGTPRGVIEALTLRANPAALWSRVTAAIRSIDAWQRVFTAAWLSTRFKCLLVGGGLDSWRRAGWNVRGATAGAVGYHELSLCYSRARAGLNVMRYQDDVGLNPKVLEIAASGCVPLVRRRAGLAEMFDDGREMMAFDTPAQAAERLREVLASPERAAALGAAARARVLREHTWRTRAAMMLDAAQTAARAS